MSTIIKFVPRRDLEASDNLKALVAMARIELTTFGPELDFDSDTWPVGRYLTIRGKNSAGRVLRFKMSYAFKDFAKAYIRYQYNLQPSTSIGNWLAALKAIELALNKENNEARIEQATAATFDCAISVISRNRYAIGKSLEQIAEFCQEHSLFAMAFQWRSPVRSDSSYRRTGKEAARRRNEKLPSAAALEALPKMFHLASEPDDILVTSVLALLCSNPCRISEVMTLPADCEVFDSFKGNPIYGLRWWPAKGAEPTVKWITPNMAEVAKQAIARIRRVTEPARRMAAWYDTNRSRLWLPPGYEGLATTGRCQTRQLAKMLQVRPRQVAQFCKDNGIAISGHDDWIEFAEFEAALLQSDEMRHQLVDRATGLKLGQALFVTRQAPVGAGGLGKWLLPRHFTSYDIARRLQPDGGTKGGSIFTRMGFFEPDGSQIKVTTHQFRHWLNTLAQRGGLSQQDIAAWSGRANIHQNQAYDHMTAEELLGRLRHIACDPINSHNLPVALCNDPVSREEYVRMMIPAAHATELGFCVHDFAFLPCQQHRDCLNCCEHCYLKGDQAREQRIRALRDDTELLLQQSLDARIDQAQGADRWTEHQQINLDRLNNLVAILDNAEIPNGTLIRAVPRVDSLTACAGHPGVL